MKRVREIITCLTLAALCGCGAEVTEPPTQMPEPVVIEATVTPAKTETPTPTPTPEPTIVIDEQKVAESEAVESMRQVWDFENGCLLESASEEQLKDAEKKAIALEYSDTKTDLFIMINAARNEFDRIKMEEEAKNQVIDGRSKKLYGTCRVTHYCNCSACCGQWAGGATASGAYPKANHTVAMDLPFGTKVMIEGCDWIIYTVEDRGVSGMSIDVYCDSHSEALSRGLYYANVYIVE